MFQRNLVIAMLFVSGSQAALVAESGHTIEGLGAVSFPVSCRPELTPAFERGVALLHSFEYVAAREAFERVAADDPACAMAQWGVSMSHFHPLWAAPTAAELAAGTAASARAAELAGAGPGSRVTDREFGYIAAIGHYWEAAAADHKTRAARYRDAMAGHSLRFPEDADAAVFHALAILGTAPPADPEHKMQKQAAAILSSWLPRLPNHPGITHYSIHAFDSPELAYLGLDAARRYARIAPAAAHALHMPSHIFVRLGLWPETIASNLDAAASARAAIARTGSGKVALEELHALDYLAYAYLQEGDDERARALAEQVARTTAIEAAALQATYGLAAIPARYALERRQWSEAAALELPSNLGVDWTKFPQMAAIISYARAIGAAKSGDQVAAGAAIAELAAFHQSLVKAPPPGPYDWAASVESLRLAAAGCLEQARGNDAEALKLLRSGADLADKVGKHPVTPGTVLPQRELLADLLLELGRPREALQEYEASLAVAPNRLNALAGAARAADRAGEAARARTFGNLVSALASPASTRPEVVAARALTGR
jgi:tetratricopeptide (TPR) repeat protein